MADIKYGSSGVGFGDTLAQMREQQTALDQLLAKEAELNAAEEKSTAGWNENAAARQKTAAAADTLATSLVRSAEVLGAETAAVQANSLAWARNAEARAAALGGSTDPAGVALASSAAIGTTAVPAARPKVTSAPTQGALFDVESGAQGSLLAAGGLAQPAIQATESSLGGYGALIAANRASLAGLAEEQALVNDTMARSAAAYTASSQALQAHGALTQEFIQSLVRGEVTLQEFSAQMVTTIGKFSGWAVAGGLVYGAFEFIKDVGSGISETQSGIEQLKRSLGEKVNEDQASSGFRRVSQEVNASIREVADAQFYAARAFKNQAESLEVAKIALEAYKLDQVNTQEAIKSFGALNVSFGLDSKGIEEVFNQLDVGQLKFNARLNQTLPQAGRAAASFANAGGSPKQLVDQLIELNRATGGGGGQGGGNPATFLIREAANLQRPATQALLATVGITGPEARNSGLVNERIQKLASEGKLSDQRLSTLATAVGGGSALGLRYGLPLFKAGETGLAADVREGTSHAGGSAAEDLSHKLAQADEQVSKIGHTFERVGSEIASIGVGAVLVDSLHAVNLLLHGVELLAQPFTLLGQVITSIPGPVREAAEAFVAYRAALALTRSGPGLAARNLTGEALGLSYLGGGSRELTAVTATQRQLVSFQTDRQEALSRASLEAATRAQIAHGQLGAFVQSPEQAAGLSDQDRVAYEQRLAELRAQAADATEKMVAAERAQVAQRQLLLKTEEDLTYLQDKKLSATTRLSGASDRGLYAAQLGSPNTLPLLGPGGASTAAETGVAFASTGTSKTAATAAEAAAGETAVEAGLASRALNAAGAGVTAMSAEIRGMGGKLRDFVGGLGLFGTAIAGVIAFQLADKISGASADAEKERTTLESLKVAPTSSEDALKKIKEAHKAAEGPGGFEEAVQEIKSGFGLFGETANERKTQGLNDLLKLTEAKEKGAFQNLGTSEHLGSSELENFSAVYTGYIEDILEGGEKAEKAKKAMEIQDKLVGDQLKLFGGRGAEGKQPLEELGTATAQLGAKAVSTGNPELIDRYASVADANLQRVIQTAQEEGKRASRLAYGSAQRKAALEKAESDLTTYFGATYDKGTELVKNELGEKQSELGRVKSEIAAKPGGTKEASLRADQQRIEGEISHRKAGLKDLSAAADTASEKIEEALEKLLAENYQKESARIKSITGLSEAKAGGNIQQREKIGVKGLEEDLKAARNLQGPEGEDKIREAETAVDEARIKIVKQKLDIVKALGARQEAEVPIKQPIESARSALSKAEGEASYIEAHKHDFSFEEIEEAGTAVLKAKRALEEQIIDNAQAVTNLEGEIQKAGEVGNAVGQAVSEIETAEKQQGLAQNQQQKLQAQLQLVNAQNKFRESLSTQVKTQEELAKSQTVEPLAIDKIEIKADEQLTKLALGPEGHVKAQAALNEAKKKYAENFVSETESYVEFELSMNRISQQQAIERYQSLLHVKDINAKTRHEIEQKIYSLETSTLQSGIFDLAPGKIKLPTVYDVHKAIGDALAAGAGADHGRTSHLVGSITQHNQIYVNVGKHSDVVAVAEAIDRVTHAGLSARLKKAGYR